MKKTLLSRVFTRYVITHFLSILVVIGLIGLSLIGYISGKIEKEMTAIHTNRLSYMQSLVEKSMLEPAEMLVLDQMMSSAFLSLPGSYSHFELYQYLRNQINPMAYIESLNVYYPGERMLISSNGVKYDYDFPLPDDAVCKLSYVHGSKTSCWGRFVNIPERFNNNHGSAQLVTYARASVAKNQEGNPVFVLFVNLYVDSIQQAISRLLAHGLEKLVVYSPGNDFILHSPPDIDDHTKNAILTTIESYKDKRLGMVEFDGKDTMLFEMNSLFTGWHYVLLMPATNFFRISSEIRLIIINVSVSALILGALLALLLAFNQYKPLRMLVSNLRSILGGDDSSSNNEYTLIERSIRHLNYSVNHLRTQMIESNLNKLLHGMLGSVDEHVFLKNLQGKYFVVAIYMLEGKDESRFEQWSSVIKEQMQHSGMDVFLAPYSRRKLSVTFNFDEMQKEQVFEWIAQAMKISPNLANQISCGVGPIVQDLELHVSCEGALDALKHRYLVEEEVLVPLYYDEVQQLPNYDGSIFYEQLSTAIKTNQLEQICDLFTRLSDEMAGTMYRYESVVLVLYRIIPIVAELMMESGAQYEGGSINAQMLANSLFNQRSIFDSLEWLSTMLRGIVSSSRSAQPTELLMDSVKLYIEENYHQEISLELLSQKTFVSSSYISQLFKRTFGIGVSEYVSQIRMNKARELLKDQNLKVEQVAEMVGLSNSTYFITKFKKTFGMTPNQYRINQKARKLNSD